MEVIGQYYTKDSMQNYYCENVKVAKAGKTAKAMKSVEVLKTAKVEKSSKGIKPIKVLRDFVRAFKKEGRFKPKH